jgi:hypothetical protein
MIKDYSWNIINPEVRINSSGFTDEVSPNYCEPNYKEGPKRLSFFYFERIKKAACYSGFLKII